MFDIKEQAKAGEVENAGTFVHIHDLSEKLLYFQDGEEEKPVGILVAGAHSHQYRQIEAQQRQRRLKPKDLTSARAFEDSVERVVFCALGWQGFLMEGKPVQFSKENLKTLLKECPWVLDQITEAMQDHSRFFTKESKQ